MKVHIQAIHFRIRPAVRTDLENRVQKLSTFHSEALNTQVFLKVENSYGRKNKCVEVRVHVPGTELFAKQTDVSFEVATSKAVSSLRTQLLKLKAK